MRVERLGPGDEGRVESAAHLFDRVPREAATLRFLASPDHHLLIAYEGAHPSGFVTGVELTHPDKGTEMFLYELSVEEPFRGRGIGRALVERLAQLARDRDCYGMWVLTDSDNSPAEATYRAAGGIQEPHQVMYSWNF